MIGFLVGLALSSRTIHIAALCIATTLLTLFAALIGAATILTLLLDIGRTP